MIIFLYGEDAYRSREHLKKMMARFKTERDPQGLNVDVIDCAKLSGEEILARACAVPFLAERRMSVLEGAVSRTSKEAQQYLAQRLQQELPASNVLVFYESQGEFKKNPLFEALKKEKYAQEFAPLNGVKREQWVGELGKAQGIVFAPGAAARIARETDDGWQTAHVVHQAASLARGRASAEVGMGDVDPFLERRLDDDIFALVDAMGNRNKKKALELLQAQWASGANDHYLFSMLARQFRLVGSVMAAKESMPSASSGELAQQLKLHPFVVKKTLGLLPRYTQAGVAQLYEKLVGMDEAAKTGKADMATLLTTFVSAL